MAGVMKMLQPSTCNVMKFLQEVSQKPSKTSQRQVKHISTVLESSKPSFTLVKLVDAENIANDELRTPDLTLEVKSITNQLQ